MSAPDPRPLNYATPPRPVPGRTAAAGCLAVAFGLAATFALVVFLISAASAAYLTVYPGGPDRRSEAAFAAGMAAAACGLFAAVAVACGRAAGRR